MHIYVYVYIYLYVWSGETEKQNPIYWDMCVASTAHDTCRLFFSQGVNDLLRDMKINFIEKTEEGKRFTDIAVRCPVVCAVSPMVSQSSL